MVGGEKKIFEVSIKGTAECHVWNHKLGKKKLVDSVILSLLKVISRAEM